MSLSKLALYNYPAIGPDEFRVLKIISIEPHIEAELSSVQYSNDPPEYYALSYAWGPEEEKTNISCNGCRFAVTPHLHDALRCIFARKGSVTLWADAICINQDDNKEKALQVVKMNEIYSNAKWVFVWLGAASSDSDKAMRYINSFKDLFMRSSKPGATADLSNEWDVDGSFSKLVIEDRPWVKNLDEPTIQAIWNLNARSWYWRLWVVQEVLLAKGFSMICGLSEVDGVVFAHFASAMLQANLSVIARSCMSILGDQWRSEGFVHMAPILQLSKLRKLPSTGKISFFARAVSLCRSRMVKEPIDRIYAFLGLDESADRFYHKNITVEYQSSKTTHLRVYIEFSKLAIVREPKLFLLSMTSSEVRPFGFPSWCPNLNSWQETSGLVDLYRAGWIEERQIPGGIAHPAFQGRLIPRVDVLPNNDSICVWGTKVDTISNVYRAYEFLGLGTETEINLHDISSSTHLIEYQKAWLEECLSMLQSLSDTQGSNVPEEFWRTIVGDFDRYRNQFPCHDDGAKMFKFYRYYLESLLESHALAIQGIPRGEVWHRVNEVAAKLGEEENWLARSQSYLIGITATWRNRSLFRTEGGRLGFASKRVQPGDLVCVFFGGRYIYVIRKNIGRDTYHFIDSGFTHGLMQGEAFSLLEKGDIKEQTFFIE